VETFKSFKRPILNLPYCNNIYTVKRYYYWIFYIHKLALSFFDIWNICVSLALGG